MGEGEWGVSGVHVRVSRGWMRVDGYCPGAQHSMEVVAIIIIESHKIKLVNERAQQEVSLD